MPIPSQLRSWFGVWIALIVGVIAGLVWGYVISPVVYVDASPSHLRQDYLAEWLRMTADSYALTRDEARAIGRMRLVGDAVTMLQSLIAEAQGVGDSDSARRLSDLLSLAQREGITNPIAPPGGGPSIAFCIGGVLLFIIASGVFSFFKGSGGMVRVRGGESAAPSGSLMSEKTEIERQYLKERERAYQESGTEPPMAQFMSTYLIGDDLYDDSFSIETPEGEFLGECGAGISETIGTGDPKKVTAIEVWLFDKSDIRTITKVVMSEYAYNDQALRAKLASKGEAVLAKVGETITLETQSLWVQARVVDLSYGSSEALPPNSFFERITVELAAWPKQAPTAAPTDVFGDTAPHY